MTRKQLEMFFFRLTLKVCGSDKNAKPPEDVTMELEVKRKIDQFTNEIALEIGLDGAMNVKG